MLGLVVVELGLTGALVALLLGLLAAVLVPVEVVVFLVMAPVRSGLGVADLVGVAVDLVEGVVATTVVIVNPPSCPSCPVPGAPPALPPGNCKQVRHPMSASRGL